MKVCFVSLSRKRERYFRRLVQHAPAGVAAQLISPAPGSLGFLLSGFVVPADLKFDLAVHERRQQLNYPRLYKYAGLRWLIRACLSCVETVRYNYYRNLLRSYRADVLCIWNGQKIPYTAVVKAAQDVGIRVVYFENGGLPDATTIDCKGINARNCLPSSADFYRSLAARREAVTESDDSVGSVRPGAGEKLCILVPLQVESDTQVVLHSPWIASNSELVGAVVAALQPHLQKDGYVLVKTHPKARASFSFSAGSNVRVIAGGDIREMIERATVVTTINSTVGLEALAAGRQVIVLGDAFYGIPGIALKVSTPQELQAGLDAVLSGKSLIDFRLLKTFLGFLREIYYIPGDWRRLEGFEQEHFRAAWLRILKADRLALEFGLS